MFLNRRTLVALAVCLCVSASPALAGGNGNGGTKKDGKISIKNNSSVQIGIVVDPTDAQQDALTPADFRRAGGKLYNPGSTANISVKAGDHDVYVVAFDIGSDLQTVTVEKGKTVKGTVDDENGLVFEEDDDE